MLCFLSSPLPYGSHQISAFLLGDERKICPGMYSLVAALLFAATLPVTRKGFYSPLHHSATELLCERDLDHCLCQVSY